MTEINCKLLIVGGGPGGYVCAIRAGQLGIDTVLVEKDHLGGTCLNVGCIPSKALIHASDEFFKMTEAAKGGSRIGVSVERPTINYPATVEWKDTIVKRLTGGVGGLLKKAGVRVVQGKAIVLDGKSVEVTSPTGKVIVKAQNVVIASGSRPAELPFMRFGADVLSSTEALALNEVPQKLAIVGGGYIGLELGTVFRKLGSNVTIIEATQSILPQYDAELTKPLATRLKQLGIQILTQTLARGWSPDGLKIESKDGLEQILAADKVLVTVGRVPNLDGWGLEGLQLTMDGSYLRVDDRCRTSMKGVFAIGDVTGEPMLAHRAMAQGEMVAEIVAGKNRSWDRYCIPAICFTDPEIVAVGLTAELAKAQGIDTRIGMFPFKANGRAMTVERDDGFVRVVARADNNVVIGVQATGVGVAELSAAFALAIESGSRLEDIAGTIHAHPSLGEAFQEASLAGLGHALHF